MLVSIGLIVILTACAIDLNVWQRLAYRYPNNVDAVIENSNVLRIGYDLTATTPYLFKTNQEAILLSKSLRFSFLGVKKMRITLQVSNFRGSIGKSNAGDWPQLGFDNECKVMSTTDKNIWIVRADYKYPHVVPNHTIPAPITTLHKLTINPNNSNLSNKNG